MKQFTSGEISKLLKVTKGTVLNYEELGMVRSGRNPENGYRYYSDLDLDELLKIRSFRGMGFSLKETQEISHCSQAEELLPLLAKKQAALTEEIARIEQSATPFACWRKGWKWSRAGRTPVPSPKAPGCCFCLLRAARKGARPWLLRARGYNKCHM